LVAGRLNQVTAGYKPEKVKLVIKLLVLSHTHHPPVPVEFKAIASDSILLHILGVVQNINLLSPCHHRMLAVVLTTMLLLQLLLL
jgi:hypothetical protein